MRRPQPLYHIGAIGVACLLVLGIRIQDIDLRPLVGPIDDRWTRVYTPYFSGLEQLDHHEVFSPINARKKKIVLLGSSVVDSIGCDSSWSEADDTRRPVRNAHYFCSIAARLNEQLHDAGLGEWQAFNLARNGAKLTSVLYIYARILELKPEVVIYGEPFPYYLLNNAQADSLNAQQYAYLDRIFDANPETKATWMAYHDNLARHGWIPPGDTSASTAVAVIPPQPRTTLSDLLVGSLTVASQRLKTEGPPLPVKFTSYRNWDEKPYVAHTFDNPDPGFAYFQGVTLIADLQKRNGGRFFFYFSPQFDHRHDVAYIDGLNEVFGRYLVRHGIPFSSYVGMELKPISETYDGGHQTLYGNQVMAHAILKDLRTLRLVE